MARYQKRGYAPKAQKYFDIIPDKAPKWVAKLHPSLDLISQNNIAPGENHYCCSHVSTRITQNYNNHFLLWKWQNHTFIKPFDLEIAAILGQQEDENKFELADATYPPGPDYFTIEPFTEYVIVQPLAVALRQAHKMGLEGSFKQYDKIILNLATQVGSDITPQHEKTFDRYEKCRNLALGTPERNERFTAMEVAYNQGRKLIDQFKAILAPTPTQEANLGDWKFWNDRGICENCKQAVHDIYISKESVFWCLNCIKANQTQSPSSAGQFQIACSRCGMTKINNPNTKFFRHPSRQNLILCEICLASIVNTAPITYSKMSPL
jgi:hypothetical protein